jgi:hypothetical protein
LIDDIEESVFRQRSCLQVLVEAGTAERDRIGKLERFDVAGVDLVERRIALRVVAAVVHQPVLRLLVDIGEPLWRHVGGDRWHESRARQ